MRLLRCCMAQHLHKSPFLVGLPTHQVSTSERCRQHCLPGLLAARPGSLASQLPLSALVHRLHQCGCCRQGSADSTSRRLASTQRGQVDRTSLILRRSLVAAGSRRGPARDKSTTSNEQLVYSMYLRAGSVPWSPGDFFAGIRSTRSEAAAGRPRRCVGPGGGRPTTGRAAKRSRPAQGTLRCWESGWGSCRRASE